MLPRIRFVPSMPVILAVSAVLLATAAPVRAQFGSFSGGGGGGFGGGGFSGGMGRGGSGGGSGGFRPSAGSVGLNRGGGFSGSDPFGATRGSPFGQMSGSQFSGFGSFGGGMNNRFGSFGGRGGQFSGMGGMGMSGMGNMGRRTGAPLYFRPTVSLPPAVADIKPRLTEILGLSPEASRNVRLETEGSMLVLRGTVPSSREKQLAEAMARLEPGVYDIRNELEVAPRAEVIPAPRRVAPLPSRPAGPPGP